MDEAYDSPDSDGHASVLSPDTTFNLSRVRHKHIEKFSLAAQLVSDSSDDENQIVVARRWGKKPNRHEGSRIKRILQPKAPNACSPDSYTSEAPTKGIKSNSEHADSSNSLGQPAIQDTVRKRFDLGHASLGGGQYMIPDEGHSSTPTQNNVAGMTLQNESFDVIDPSRVLDGTQSYESMQSNSSVIPAETLEKKTTDTGVAKNIIPVLIISSEPSTNSKNASHGDLPNQARNFVSQRGSAVVAGTRTHEEPTGQLSCNLEENETSNSLLSDLPSTPESAVPIHPFHGFDLAKLKKSKFARRMSMNTPPSHTSRHTTVSEALEKNPPSILDGSDYRFPSNPLRYGSWNPTGVPLEFSPLLHDEHWQCSNAPPNSIRTSPSLEIRQTAWLMYNRQGRVRSKSDPLSGKVGRSPDESYGEMMLFTPTRINYKSEVLDPIPNPLVPERFIEKEHRNITMPEVVYQPSQSSIHVGYNTDTTHLPCDLKCQLVGNFPKSENQPMEPIVSTNCDSVATCRVSGTPASLQLEGVEFRVQTPSSVESTMKTSTSIDYATSYNLDLSNKVNPPLNENSNSMLTMDSPGLVFQPKVVLTSHYRCTTPEDYQEHRSDTRERQSPLSHQGEVEVRAHHILPENRSEISVNKETEDIFNPNQSIAPSFVNLRHRSENLDLLYNKICALEQTVSDLEKDRQCQIKERDLKITHLQGIAGSKLQPSYESSLTQRIFLLECQLQDTRNQHQHDIYTREEKFANILHERDAELNHLQAELDEMTNLVPLDQSTRLFPRGFEEEGDSWMVDKSRDLTHIFEESLDQIITEIQGDPGREDFDEAAEQAELSLRRIAMNAGYVEEMDKTSLAAFGIRQMREENKTLKKLVTDGRDRLSEIRLDNQAIQSEQEALKTTIKNLNGKNTTMQASLEEYTRTMTDTRAHIESLLLELKEKNEILKELKTENTKLRTSEEALKIAETDNKNLKNTCSNIKAQLSAANSRVTDLEQKGQGLMETVTNTREEIRESNLNTKNINSELVETQKRLSGLKFTEKALREQYTNLEAQSKHNILKLIEETAASELLAQKLHSSTTVIEQAKKNLELTKTESEGLRQKVSHLERSLNTAQNQKAALQAAVSRIETEQVQMRSRIHGILSETAEKEGRWQAIRESQDCKLHDLSVKLQESVIPYLRSISRIAQEFDGMNMNDTNLSNHFLEELRAESVAMPDIVVKILTGIRCFQLLNKDLDGKMHELEDKNERLKIAIKRWGLENAKEKGRAEKTARENMELMLRLKAEKKQSDEKISSLILALRR